MIGPTEDDLKFVTHKSTQELIIKIGKIIWR